MSAKKNKKYIFSHVFPKPANPQAHFLAKSFKNTFFRNQQIYKLVALNSRSLCYYYFKPADLQSHVFRKQAKEIKYLQNSRSTRTLQVICKTRLQCRVLYKLLAVCHVFLFNMVRAYLIVQFLCYLFIFYSFLFIYSFFQGFLVDKLQAYQSNFYTCWLV